LTGEGDLKFLFGGLIGKLLTTAVVLVVAAGAGWYFFIREENSAQETAGDITDEVKQAAQTATQAAGTTAPGTQAAGTTQTPSNTGAGASSYAGKSYGIIEGQSSAWYLAPEKIARLPTSSTAKGVTTGVSGQFHVTANGLDSSKPTSFTVDLTKLQSDESRRDTRTQSALETTKYPTTTFTATKITGLPAEFGSTDTILQLTGTMDLHGVKKEITWELKVKKDGSILSVLGTTEFKYSDFGIQKPDIAGMVTVEDNVTLQVQLFLQEG